MNEFERVIIPVGSVEECQRGFGGLSNYYHVALTLKNLGYNVMMIDIQSMKDIDLILSMNYGSCILMLKNSVKYFREKRIISKTELAVVRRCLNGFALSARLRN